MWRSISVIIFYQWNFFMSTENEFLLLVLDTKAYWLENAGERRRKGNMWRISMSFAGGPPVCRTARLSRDHLYRKRTRIKDTASYLGSRLSCKKMWHPTGRFLSTFFFSRLSCLCIHLSFCLFFRRATETDIFGLTFLNLLVEFAARVLFIVNSILELTWYLYQHFL